MVRQKCLPALMSLALDEDLAVKRDAVLALANLSDSLELQTDLVREGVLRVLGQTGRHEDARVQRDTARAFSALSVTDDIKSEIILQDALPTILILAKSLDIACQRYSTLTLCNLCSGSHKVRIVEDGGVRPLIFLSRFPDTEIQRYAALAVAGLALGGHGQNKLKIGDPHVHIMSIVHFYLIERYLNVYTLQYSPRGHCQASGRSR